MNATSALAAERLRNTNINITMSNARIAVHALLEALGEDPNREGLKGTPERVARMLVQHQTPERFEFTTFASEGMSELIVQAPIPFYSLCEHHLLPFFGTAAVSYIPGERIVGLSKLARAVACCAAGLQNQERITVSVADMLEENLKPQGVGVVLRARHLCMEMRGARAPGVLSTTSCLRGALLENAETRAEFLRLAEGSL